MLPTNRPALFASAVQRAVELLRAGELVALPTETVYGLAANAFDARAVARIFDVKRRPPDNPIIVHVASLEMARRCVLEWPTAAERLAAAFWPGPLTLVLPRAALIPPIATAGGPTVGVRWPRHPLVQAVIRECGFPLAAPSANVSTRVSPTNAEHVRRSLGGRIPLIIDGGQTQVGIESTVLDLTEDSPRVLRPGMIHEESLAAVLEKETQGLRPDRVPGATASPLRSPGQLPKHYAPRAHLALWLWRDEADLVAQLTRCGWSPPATWVIASTRIPSPTEFLGVSAMPRGPEAFGRALYAELHRCDEEGAAVVIVEAPPETPRWRAITDRLRRAAA